MSRANRPEWPTAQFRAVGGDQAAPDAVLADVPVLQREVQALAAHPAGGADCDRRGRLPTSLARLGGTVSVLSPPGNGTDLHVQLPADPMARPAPGGTP